MSDSVQTDLIYAILALDSYNRLAGDGAAFGQGDKLGDFITYRRPNPPDRSQWNSDGFYAISFRNAQTGEIVVSFRGTDQFTTDLYNGYGLALGNTPLHQYFDSNLSHLMGVEQAVDAATYYTEITGKLDSQFAANVTLVGHSLGAGLAGYLNATTGTRAVVFDNLPYDVSGVNRAGELGVQASFANVRGYFTDQEFLQSARDGTIQAAISAALAVAAIPVAELAAFRDAFALLDTSMQGADLAARTRSFENTWAKTPLYSRTDAIANVAIDSVSGYHNQAMLVALLWNKGFGDARWEPAARYLWDAFFDETIATHLPLAGVLLASGATGTPLDVVQSAIAYSAVIESDGMDTGKPFGDSAIRAMFDDAGDLGDALLAIAAQPQPFATLAEFVGRSLVQYAASIALTPVLRTVPESTNGILGWDAANHLLTIDYSDHRWTIGGATSTGISGKADVIDALVGTLPEIDAIRQWLGVSGSLSGQFDRLQLALGGTNAAAVLPEPIGDHGNLYVALAGSAAIDGSSDQDMVLGGTGGDLLNGGGGDDILLGGPGSDTLDGGAGSNLLAGGSGDDRYTWFPGDGPNAIFDISGNDTLVIDVTGLGLTIDQVFQGSTEVSFLAITISGLANIEHVEWVGIDSPAVEQGIYLEGTDESEYLQGTGFNDTISGYGGSDHIVGGGGIDDIRGGDGNDRIEATGYLDGDGGADILIGGGQLYGGDGNDRIELQDTWIARLGDGGAGNDTIDGTDAIDQLDGGPGADLIVAGGGLDIISGDGTDQGAGADTIDAGAGPDLIRAGGGNDSIDAGAGDDKIVLGFGYIQSDLRYGMTFVYDYDVEWQIIGNDWAANSHWLISSPRNFAYIDGVDTVLAGEGDDQVSVGFGNWYVDGGSGNDGINFTQLQLYGLAHGVTVNLSISGPQNTGTGSPQFVSIENVAGTMFADSIAGSAAQNVILGGGGDDLLATGLQPTVGRDIFDGGDGDDLILYQSAGAIIVGGGPGQDTLQIQVDFDTDWSLSDIERFIGGPGRDVVRQESNTGHTPGNVITVYTNPDGVFFEGRGGNDELHGAEMSDRLDGGDGNDTLYANRGNDTLSGGAGDDVLMDGNVPDYIDNLRQQYPGKTIVYENGLTPDDSGNDLFDGGDGFDSVSYFYAKGAIGVEMAAGRVADGTGATDRLISIERIYGSRFDDTMTGGAASETLVGNDGDDLFLTGREDAPGVADFYYGGAGNDTFRFQHRGDLNFNGGDGYDTLIVEVSGSSWNWGDNMEHFIGGSGADEITQNVAHAHADWLEGRGGDDTLVGSNGNDRLEGGDGDDQLSGRNGDDSLVGGFGTDIAVFQGAFADYAIVGNTLSATVQDHRTAGEGRDSLTSIERLRFSDGLYLYSAAAGLWVSAPSADAIGFGTQGPDRLTGTGAANLLSGLGGADRLSGDAGNDTLDGGAGNDIAIYAATRAQATVTRDPAAQGLTVTTLSEGTDTVSRVEQFQFSDGLYSFNFARAANTLANFGAQQGWTDQSVLTRHLADVNGDGRLDIVGIGYSAVRVALGNGDGTFQAAKVAVANYGVAQDWVNQDVYPRVLADVNGDGRADLLGFGYAGVKVALGQADGTFGAATLGAANFGGAQGWSSATAFPRLLADLNGDGKLDILGFGYSAVRVALGNGDGTFQAAKVGVANFGQGLGWSDDDAFHRELADVNGDGRLDIVGFGHSGVRIALANANGSFAAAQLAVSAFGQLDGWASQDVTPRMLADLNHDGTLDVIGFGPQGTSIAYGHGDGTFTAASSDLANFGLAQGWTSDRLYHRELGDIDEDGLPDIVGFGNGGAIVAMNQGDVLV